MKQFFTLPAISVRLLAALLALVLCTGTSALQAQTVPTPTQTDEILLPDNGTPGKADPGDKIRYKVTIQNTAPSTPANGVQLNAAPDSRTTLDNTSFRTSPLAFADAYSAIGNVGIVVPAASGLLVNDYDDNIPGLTATVVSNVATTQGGSITIAADGGFSYNPPSGFEGMDTYQYTLEDGNEVAGVMATDLGTITITVSGMIWFINNNVGACASSCDGRLSNPYTSLSAFNTANALAGGLNPDNNDNIFLYESAAPYTNGIVLRNGQKLFGQDASATLAAMTGLTPPTFSNALPATNSVNGTFAIITNAAGDGITLPSGSNTVRGVTVGDCSDFAIESSNAGTLTITETSINNAIGGGFRNTANGILAVTLSSLTSTGGVHAVNLTGTSGSFTVTGTTTALGHSNDAILLSGLSTTVTFGVTNVTAAGSNQAIQIQNNTGPISFATGSSATGSSSEEILLNGGNGNVTYNGTVINTSGGAISVISRTGGTVDFTGNISHTAAGTGILANINTGGTINFSGASKSINSSTSTAVDLATNTGTTINFTGGGLVITTTTGTGFNATGGITVNVSGTGNTITKSGSGNALNIVSASAGGSGINFASVNVTGGTGTAVNISASTGVKSLGDVDVARGGGGSGIVASNAGTLNTSDGTINSGNQVAIDIDNTVLGIVLTSVSANGAANGIDVNTTTGTFTINGISTTNGTGGTIQNIATRGASFISATNITLKNMAFTNANTVDAGLGMCDYASALNCNGALYMRNITTLVLDNVDVNGAQEQGLNGDNITTMTVTGCSFTNCGDEQEEGCMKIRSLQGTCSIVNSTFSFAHEELVEIYNATTPNALNLTVDNCDFTDTQTSLNGERGIWVEFSNAVTSTVNIDFCRFTRVKTQGVRLNANGTATVNLNVTDSNFDRMGGLGSGVTIVSEVDANVNTNINRNTLTMINDNAVTLEIRGTTNMQARVNNNTITGPGPGQGGDGIFINSQDAAFATIESRNNNITGISLGSDGVRSVARGDGTLHSTIDNNNITMNGTSMSSAGYAIEVRSGSVANPPAENALQCANVINNDVNPASTFYLADFRTRIPNSAADINLQGGVAMTSSAAVWAANGNTGPGIVSQNIVAGGTITFGAAPCLTVGHPNAMADPSDPMPGSRLLKIKESTGIAGINAPQTHSFQTNTE